MSQVTGGGRGGHGPDTFGGGGADGSGTVGGGPGTVGDDGADGSGTSSQLEYFRQKHLKYWSYKNMAHN